MFSSLFLVALLALSPSLAASSPHSKQPTTSAPKSTSTTAAPAATSTPFNGQGNLIVQFTNGVADGCMTDAGLWTIGGTCAVVTGAVIGTDVFTLTTPAGKCGLGSNNNMECSSTVTQENWHNYPPNFNFVAYGHVQSGVFYAPSLPSGTGAEQLVISPTNTEVVQLVWKAL